MTQWPELPVLELLALVESQGSLGAAARELGLAQPNASRAVSRLERQLGLVLLVRTHQGSTLAPDGRRLVEASREVLDAAARWRDEVSTMTTGAREVLEFAASQTVAEYLAPGWLATMHARMPAVEVSLRVTNSQAVMALVATQQVAIGFVETPSIAAGLSSRTVRTDRLCVVVDPGHRWARRRRPLTLEALAAAHLVVRETGSGTRETLEAAFASHLPEAPVVRPGMTLSSNTAVLGACAAGAGPAVLSELAVERAVDSGQVVRVPVAEPEALSRELRAVWQGPRPGVVAAELLRIARQL